MLYPVWPSEAHAHLPECIGLSFVKHVDESVHTRVGVCLDGTREGETLVMTTLNDEDLTLPTTSVLETVYVFASNPFGLPCGAKCQLSVDPNNSPDVSESDLGATMFDHAEGAVAVTFDVLDHKDKEDPPRPKKKRTLVTPATMPSGTQLTVRETMDALVNWLEEKNALHAGRHGVAQIVWSEEQPSTRSSAGGQLRGWFRHDVADGCKRKTCPHASSAIEYMQHVCGASFYSDMRLSGHKYHKPARK
jgi:hypothetical protein